VVEQLFFGGFQNSSLSAYFYCTHPFTLPPAEPSVLLFHDLFFSLYEIVHETVSSSSLDGCEILFKRGSIVPLCVEEIVFFSPFRESIV